MEHLELEAVSFANNHMLDFGQACRDRSVEVAERNNVLQSGEKGTIAYDTDNDVAFIAFHTHFLSNDVNNIDEAAATVRKASAKAKRVVVTFHGGAEGAEAMHLPNGPETYFGSQRGDLRRFSRAVIDAGADVVIG